MVSIYWERLQLFAARRWLLRRARAVRGLDRHPQWRAARVQRAGLR